LPITDIPVADSDSTEFDWIFQRMRRTSGTDIGYEGFMESIVQRWKTSPAAFFMALSFINWLGFSAWNALLNNFAHEQANFTGFHIGVLQSVREIPGFLAFTAIFIILFIKEQTLAYLALLMLGLGVALTGYFPTLTGLLITTFIMSVGFHYFETMNQSLSLQLLRKEETAKVLGNVAGAGAVAQFLAYGALIIAWQFGFDDYRNAFLVVGVLAIALTILAIGFFKRFEGTVPQRKSIVLRSRYWLYYLITMMSGARRQIFMAFAAFLLVVRFGYTVRDIALLMLVTAALNTFGAPLIGRMIASLGERRTIIVENISLIIVFAGYAAAYSGHVPAFVAPALFILDGVFFTFTIAQRTYIQKIGDSADMAPTAAVSFTINHIMAVVIPVTFGLIWNANPAYVFLLGVGIATCSLVLAFMVPHDPGPGRETIFETQRPSLQPAE
jgi:predicted MFS family arabinose efflux permease